MKSQFADESEGQPALTKQLHRIRKTSRSRRIDSFVRVLKDPSRLRVGQVCGVSLKALSPTQATVGFIQVYTQAEKMFALKGKKLQRDLLAKPISVLVAPNRKLYILDHHHLAAAMWVAGFEEGVIEIKESCRGMKRGAFLAKMRREKKLHLYDAHGKELADASELPERIDRLADNFFQSVAWAVQKEGGYAKSQVPVSAFEWAEYFRAKLKLNSRSTFKKCVRRAKRLARAPEAADLPGYIIR